MSLPDNLQNLSQRELLQLLQATEAARIAAENARTAAEVEKLKSEQSLQTTKADLLAARAQVCIEKKERLQTEQQLKQAKADRETMAVAVQVRDEAIKEFREMFDILFNAGLEAKILQEALLSKATQESYGDFAQDLEMRKFVAEIVTRIIQLAATNEKYRAYFANKGNESINKTPAATENAADPQKAICGELMEDVSQLQKAEEKCRQNAAALLKALENMSSEQKTPADKAIEDGLKTPVPKQKNKAAAKRGRRRVEAPTRKGKKVKPTIPMTTCPYCGQKMMDAAAVEAIVRNMQIPSQKLYDKIAAQLKVMHCSNPKCRAVSVASADDFHPPLVPGRQLPTNAVVHAAASTWHGIPIERVKNFLYRGAKLGNDTLWCALDDMDRIYMSPLLVGIEKRKQQTKILIADETTYAVLEQQGIGCKRNSASQDTTTTQYLEVLTSGDVAGGSKFVIYRAMRSRSAESIAKAIGTDARFSYLIADGYSAYESPKFKGLYQYIFQADHVHARRRIYQALDYKNFNAAVAAFEKLHPGIDYMSFHLAENSVSVKLMGVLFLWSKVFAWEDTVKPLSGETEAQRLKRVQKMRDDHVRPLMDNIDVIMNEVARTVAKQAKNGSWSGLNGSKYGDAVAYYMNRRESLRSFLTIPQLICHSNSVEQKVRPVTLLRKGNYFMQTNDGMDLICKYLTLFGTLELNGIEDDEGFLTSYVDAAFRYCVSKRWSQELENTTGKNPTTSFRGGWKMEELIQGFDSEPWIRWMFGGTPPTDAEIRRASSYRPEPA